MDLEETKISIGEKMEMIQINGELTNFHSSFRITSDDGAPFSAIVISHTALDEAGEDNIEFKSAPKGIFAGEITQASNEPDSWYILVRAPKPTNATLSLHTQEIEGNQADEVDSPKKGLSPLTIAIIVAVVLIVGFIVYKLFFSGSPSQLPDIAVKIPSPAPALPEVVASLPVPEAPFSVADLDLSDLPPI